jgi:GxxExxY protein
MKYEKRLRDQLSGEPSPELKALLHRVIGCAIEVHRVLGPGYFERTYHLAMEAELETAGISFHSQVPLDLSYKGRAVGEYRLDLVIDDRVVVELKAVDSLGSVHIAQVVSYLKATKLPVGLLLNFNVPVLIQGVRRVLPPK